jgi:hypothetical protein
LDTAFSAAPARYGWPAPAPCSPTPEVRQSGYSPPRCCSSIPTTAPRPRLLRRPGLLHADHRRRGLPVWTPARRRHRSAHRRYLYGSSDADSCRIMGVGDAKETSLKGRGFKPRRARRSQEKHRPARHREKTGPCGAVEDGAAAAPWKSMPMPRGGDRAGAVAWKSGASAPRRASSKSAGFSPGSIRPAGQSLRP